MRQPLLMMSVALVTLLASAGCGGEAALRRRADVACEAVAAAAASAPTEVRDAGEPSSRPDVDQTLLFAPREVRPEGEHAADPADAGAPAAAEPPAAPPPEPREPFAAIKGRPIKEVILDDLRAVPRRVGRGLKHTYARPENLIILGTAFGADRIVRHNWDGEIRDELRYNDTSLAETDDFGTIIGNPALHFGVAGAWYLTALHKQDQGHYEKSRTMIQALMVNGLSTMLLKVSMDDETPNDEEWGWPSGHTSSSMCVAAVMHEYYGWKAGVPLYLLAGYSAATRLEDREHDLSDVIFGAALGLTIGHSVVRGELPQVAGFHLLPYGGRDAGGLMLVKQW
ncbi:MAG: phosphatase PAP2 family protein [Phycisphaerae bacterium]